MEKLTAGDILDRRNDGSYFLFSSSVFSLFVCFFASRVMDDFVLCCFNNVLFRIVLFVRSFRPNRVNDDARHLTRASIYH